MVKYTRTIQENLLIKIMDLQLVYQPIIQKANTVAKSMWAEHPLFTIIGGYA